VPSQRDSVIVWVAYRIQTILARALPATQRGALRPAHARRHWHLPADDRYFSIGVAMNKSLTLLMGNYSHRMCIPELIRLVTAGVVKPSRILTDYEALRSAIGAYRAFDQRKPG
jgi:hypothetical protein